MEHLSTEADSAFNEAGGPPSLFAVGCFNGVVHLIRFGPEDTYYDVQREAKRLRRSWSKANRLDKHRGNATQ